MLKIRYLTPGRRGEIQVADVADCFLVRKFLCYIGIILQTVESIDLEFPYSHTLFNSFSGQGVDARSMQKPFMRIPYTGPLPPPVVLPFIARTPTGAAHALSNFLSFPCSGSAASPLAKPPRTVLLTGAGISVASGLADYRGTAGTYTLNKTYRPIYYNEFVSSHAARQRYWARSFLGWTILSRARPNPAHEAIKELGELGCISSVITQSTSLNKVPRSSPFRIQVFSDFDYC